MKSDKPGFLGELLTSLMECEVSETNELILPLAQLRCSFRKMCFAMAWSSLDVTCHMLHAHQYYLVSELLFL